MTDVLISKVNESFLKVGSNDRSILMEISERFSFKAHNAEFQPKVKYGYWDGIIRLFNLRNRLLPLGLKNDLIEFLEGNGYTYELKNYNEEIKLPNNVKDFFENKLKSKLTPYDHQLKAFLECIKNKRLVCLSATASGKSFIIYMLAKYYAPKKILIIVPRLSLIKQLAQDFEDYGGGLTISKKDIHKEADVLITTWQSIYKLPKEYFSKFECVIGDECHHFKATSLVSIMKKCENAKYRFGFTGTLDGVEVNDMTIKAYFGEIVNISSSKDLINKGYLSNLEIRNIVLKYSNEYLKEIKKLRREKKFTYHKEMEFIVSNEKRNNIIINLANNLKGNTLILFRYVDKHGIPLYENMKKKSKKDIFFVSGQVEAEAREKIRKTVDKHKNAVLIASFGTFSTGINIRNIHNIIFASPTKSKITVLQSIGRGLRLSDNGEKCVVYDITDDMRYGKYVNTTLKHFIERLKIYKNEGFEYKTIEVSL